MALANVVSTEEMLERTIPGGAPLNAGGFGASAVSWGAIFAGAAAAAALSLILLILGTGLGLSSVSPWAQSGVSATTFGVSAILWVTLTQVLAAALGGYLAGRLRTKWLATHRDEVYFRDTVHGFLAWAVASLASAALLASAIGSIAKTGVEAGASVAGGAATAAVGAAAGSAAARVDSANAPMGYFVDSLFRKDVNAPATAPAADSALTGSNPEQTAAASSQEVNRIFLNAIQTATLPADDVRYVGQVVARRTGLPQAEAEKRVSDTYARARATVRDAEVAAKDAADKARKASAYAAMWLFISLLIGAFVASLAATFGGRQRGL